MIFYLFLIVLIVIGMSLSRNYAAFCVFLTLCVLVGPRISLFPVEYPARPIEIRIEDILLVSVGSFLFVRSLLKESLTSVSFTIESILMVTFLALIVLSNLVGTNTMFRFLYLIPMAKGCALVLLIAMVYDFYPLNLNQIKCSARWMAMSSITALVILCGFSLYQKISTDYNGELLFGKIFGTERFHSLSAAWTGKIQMGRSTLPFEREPAVSGFVLAFIFGMCAPILYEKISLFKKVGIFICLWGCLIIGVIPTQSRAAVIIALIAPLILFTARSILATQIIFVVIILISLFTSIFIKLLMPILRFFLSKLPLDYDKNLQSLELRSGIFEQMQIFKRPLFEILFGMPSYWTVFDNQYSALVYMYGLVGLSVFAIVMLRAIESSSRLRISWQKIILRYGFLVVCIASLTIEGMRNFRLVGALFLVLSMFLIPKNKEISEI